jgi:hypothetical protein
MPLSAATSSQLAIIPSKQLPRPSMPDAVSRYSSP